jgi:hypothetical protein
VPRFNFLHLGKTSTQRWVDPKMLSNEELLIALRRQINFERDQKAAAIDQTTGRDRLVERDRVFGHL